MVTVILGILALAYGLFTLYLRIFKQSKGLGKLDRMKEVYGVTCKHPWHNMT